MFFICICVFVVRNAYCVLPDTPHDISLTQCDMRNTIYKIWMIIDK